MVALLRRGQSLRAVARLHGIALATVQRWRRRAQGRRLDRADWTDHATGCRRPKHRTTQAVEHRVLSVRKELQQRSDLGEYGAAAIRRTLVERAGQRSRWRVPSLRTIGRILARRGVLDGRRRPRRAAPPRGWFLPDVAAGQVELDSFDIVEDLRIERGPFVHVLNGISLHGGLCVSWPRRQITAKNTVPSLIEHWRAVGLPGYVKFDNDTVFQGTHRFADAFGRVIRLCVSLGVVPVFTPPGEHGFQADIENYNGRWQAKVWRRFRFATVAQVVRQSDRFVVACRQRSASRIEAAPPRRRFPADWRFNLQAPLRGKVIFLRRTSERGTIRLLGHTWPVSPTWCHRLVRVELDLTRGCIRIHGLRRRDPKAQPLLARHAYRVPRKRFQE